MRRAVALVVLVAVAAAACSDEQAVGPAPLSPAPTSDVAAAGTAVPQEPGPMTPDTVPDTDPDTMGDGPDEDAVVPVGYERVQATVTESDGTVCEICLWVADTAERRSRGLMFVTDLGAADGMAFIYPAPHSGNFWMKNTVLPLSIAFFGPTGEYMAAFDMEPCVAEPCPVYPTPDDFSIAIETRQSGLGALGIALGSVLALTDAPCDAST